MTSGILEILEELLPDVRMATGLPPWLIDDGEVGHILRQLDEETIKPLMTLGGTEARGMDLSSIKDVSTEARQSAIKAWAEHHHVMPVLWTLDELVNAVYNILPELKIEPALIKKSLPVLVMACFFPGGEGILSQMAGALGSDVEKPDTAIDACRKAITRGEPARLKQLAAMVQADPLWNSWVEQFIKLGECLEVERRNRPGRPTGLAVEALTKMLTEVEGARRHHPQEAGSEDTTGGGGAAPVAR